ncbi:hypothetical protein SKAU_G00058270 [Synaphobranchus kaupii]|uniref:Uncharacterized protein n=1 Tax=Synaphobranchus kaupii TaxID=118154 RepID=A0A9Q1G4D7_SYNKA|nr:hypothetical protein SKAU_G00058270 [Synaphobranchus kaupii]
MPLLRSKRADIRNDPDVMVIHLGGNSIGTYGNTRISLMRCMKTDIREIDLLFPKTKLMFSDILPRWNWRGQTATTRYGLERTRRRLNGAMFGFLSDMALSSPQHRVEKTHTSSLRHREEIVESTPHLRGEESRFSGSSVRHQVRGRSPDRRIAHPPYGQREIHWSADRGSPDSVAPHQNVRCSVVN